MPVRAIVIGGSIAGLLAARVLSDFFDKVLIVERDIPPSTPGSRKGVPQGNHAHGLLAGGRARLERLFPGMFEGMVAGGAIPVDSGQDIAWFSNHAWRLRAPLGAGSYLQSRPFLEFHVREHVRKLRNLSEICASAIGLAFDKGAERVTGVRVARRGEEETVIPADLVVDCSGRGSRLPQWLESMGFPRPPVSTVRVDVGYSSRYFEFRNGHEPDWHGMLIIGAPPDGNRQGVMFRAEGNRWQATLAGMFRDYPPNDERGFLEYANSLEQPHLCQVLRDATPVSEIATYRFSAHQRHHYERLQRFPAGLLTMGDAVCSFSPTYGQGMTVAAIEAEILQQSLRQTKGSAQKLWRAFFHRIAEPVQTAWALATGGDLAFPQTEGERPSSGRWRKQYLGHVLALCSSDAVVLREWTQVAHMVAPFPVLFHPRIATRVLRHAIASRSPRRTT